MTTLVQSVWKYILSAATGKTPDELAVERDDLSARVQSYTSKFDKKLSEQWNEKKDSEMKKERIANAQDMTNAYYDIATDFYEYGWGQSFHFATRYEGEAFEQSLARHEHFLAYKLNLQQGQTCIDVGCGIGGPLREISRFTRAKVIGINNNAYQVSRALRLNKRAGLEEITDVIKSDFMSLPLTHNSIDAAYAIEATCHAPDRTGCFRQVFNVLKPGGYFAGYEWTMTDKYDPKNPQHNQIKHGIEEGNSLPTLTHYTDIIRHLKAAGFEVIEHYDLATVELFGPIPWYSTFLGGMSLSQFKHTSFGRMCTNAMCETMERLHVAPKGTAETARILSKTGDALAESGKTGIFTPMYYFLVRKPEDSSSSSSSSNSASSPTSNKSNSKKSNK